MLPQLRDCVLPERINLSGDRWMEVEAPGDGRFHPRRNCRGASQILRYMSCTSSGREGSAVNIEAPELRPGLRAIARGTIVTRSRFEQTMLAKR